MSILRTEISKEMGFSFDKRLARNLFWLRQAVLKQDFDSCILVDGPEGSGKSVLGQQVAKYLDVDRHIDLDTQMCYYPAQFKKAIMTLKKGKAIIWDEARRGLNRRRSMGEVNLDITDLLAECRQHNLFLIVIMPTFYDMDMNVAVWRSRALIHVWYTWDTSNMEKPLLRGFFRFYSEKGKKELYVNPHNRRGYRYPRLPSSCFEGRFPNHYVVDEQKYRDKKAEAEKYFREGGETGKKGLLCPECQGKDIRFIKSEGLINCRRCGHKWKKQ